MAEPLFKGKILLLEQTEYLNRLSKKKREKFKCVFNSRVQTNPTSRPQQVKGQKRCVAATSESDPDVAFVSSRGGVASLRLAPALLHGDEDEADGGGEQQVHGLVQQFGREDAPDEEVVAQRRHQHDVGRRRH